MFDPLFMVGGILALLLHFGLLMIIKQMDIGTWGIVITYIIAILVIVVIWFVINMIGFMLGGG